MKTADRNDLDLNIALGRAVLSVLALVSWYIDPANGGWLWLLETWSGRTETTGWPGRLAAPADEADHLRVCFASGQYHLRRIGRSPRDLRRIRF
jgi:hypothetical protein